MNPLFHLKILIFLCLGIFSSVSVGNTGILLPRMGAVIELDQVTPKDPWEDRSSRLQWVFARLHCEGIRVWLLPPKGPWTGCQILYLDGPAFKEGLHALKDEKIGILQSALHKLFPDDQVDRTIQASSRVSLKFHRSGKRRVVTVVPDLSECFYDYDALKVLGDAIMWLAGLPEDGPRIAPFPYGKRSAVIFIVHGEGETEKMDEFQREFLNGPGVLTYAVSEDAIRHYPQIIKTFTKSDLHEVAIHNHLSKEYETQDKVLSANLKLHRETLEGHRPAGLIGPYLVYFNDLREALVKHRFRWFLDKDLPYPLNIPASSEAEPVIDITESLKPYDGWWNLQDAETLWRQGLIWKRMKGEIAVASWHDVHMGREPQPFLKFMHYVRELPEVWQTTALHFQTFWRDRWRAQVEILSNDHRHIIIRTNQVPPGLTLLRRRNGKTEMALIPEGISRGRRLDWKPWSSVENPQGPGTIDVKWGPVGSIMPRNRLDTEFAILNRGEKMLWEETILLPLPEALWSRIDKGRPSHLWITTYGVKGLKFKDIKVEKFIKGRPIPPRLSIEIDKLPGQSIRFYRLRFPISEKPKGLLSRWIQSLRKRPFLTLALGIMALMMTLLFTRKYYLRRWRGKGEDDKGRDILKEKRRDT